MMALPRIPAPAQPILIPALDMGGAPRGSQRSPIQAADLSVTSSRTRSSTQFAIE